MRANDEQAEENNEPDYSAHSVGTEDTVYDQVRLDSDGNSIFGEISRPGSEDLIDTRPDLDKEKTIFENAESVHIVGPRVMQGLVDVLAEGKHRCKSREGTVSKLPVLDE